MEEELAIQVKIAVALLKGYAAYDHRIGHFEDEAFCRQRIAVFDELLAEFEVRDRCAPLESFPVVESGAYS